MKKFKIIVLIFFPTILLAQAPSIAWQKRIGGNKADIASAMVPTADGGFIMGGRSHSDTGYEKTDYCRGGSDYWIIKTDSNGIIEWDKTIGGAQTPGQFPSYEFDVMRSVIQTPDGGYFLCGDSSSPISGEKTESCRGDYDYWCLKLSPSGTIEWQKTIGGSFLDSGAQAINTIDGGYLVYGNSVSEISGDKTDVCRGNSDIWLVKLSITGSIEWQKTIGGSDIDSVSSLIQNSDSTYTIAGASSSNISGEKTENSRGFTDIWLLKINPLGEILQQKTIGGSERDGATGIITTNDGGFLISATSNSPVSGEKTDFCRGGDDCWLLKVDASFDIIWQKTYGGSSDEYCRNPYQTNDNGYIIGCSSQSGISGEKLTQVSGYTDAWILKINQIGEIQWQKTIGGYAPGIYDGQDFLSNPAQLSDGSFVMFGGTSSNISGDIVDFPRGETDYWLVKLNPENLSNQTYNLYNDVKLFPNPANQFVAIQNSNNLNEIFKYKIIELTGKIVKVGNSRFNEKIDIENLQRGNYIIQIIGENKNLFYQKFIKK